MKIKLYDFLMKLINNLKHSDKIIIKADCFSKDYDNIYQLLDKFHLLPEVKDFYKDYIVDGYNIVFTGSNPNTGRSIYIYINK